MNGDTSSENIYESILKLFQNLHIPLSLETKEELRNLDPDTLLRVKSLFIGVKSLLEIHEKLQDEIAILTKNKAETQQINNMMDQLAENLKKLEETKVKELMSDLINRFLDSMSYHPQIIYKDDISFTNISDLLEFFTPSIVKSESTSEQSPETASSTIIPNEDEFQRFQTILMEKDAKIAKLEEEIQIKIRELEAVHTDLTRFQELNEEVHALRARNAELEKAFESQKTENSILTNENKLFQRRFQEITEELEQKNNQLAEYQLDIPKIEEFQSKIDTYEQENMNLLEEKHSLQSILDDLHDKTEHLTHELDKKQKNLQNLQSLYDQLENSVSLKDSRIEELQRDLQNAQQELSHLRETFNSTQEDRSSLEAGLSAHLQEKELMITDLKQELHELQEKLQKMVYREELESVNNKLDEAEQQLIQKDEYLRDKTSQIQELHQTHQKEKEELFAKIEELQQKIASQENLAEQLREKDSIIEELQKQEEEFHDALLENVKITAEKEELNEKIAELISQKEVLFDRISELKRENSGNKAIIQRLEKQLESLQQEYQKAQELTPEMIKDNIEKEFLQKQVDSLNKELREQLALASESSGKYQVMKDQYDQLKKELKDLQDKFDSIRQDNLNLQRRFQEQKVEFSEKIADLEKNLALTERKASEMETELLKAQNGGEYKAEIEKLRSELDAKNQEIQQFQEQISNLQAELTLGKKEIARLNEEIVNYRRRIKILRRNLSSSSSE